MSQLFPSVIHQLHMRKDKAADLFLWYFSLPPIISSYCLLAWLTFFFFYFLLSCFSPFLFSLFFFSSIFSPILWVKLCLSKNIYIKNPNLQYHRIGPYLETRSLSMYLIKVRSYWSREGLKSNMAGIFIRKGKGEDAAGRWSYED